jgi:hypothetical protein
LSYHAPGSLWYWIVYGIGEDPPADHPEIFRTTRPGSFPVPREQRDNDDET